MTRSAVSGLQRLLGLLHLLRGLVQLVQVLAMGQIPLDALADMVAVGFVLDRSLMAALRRRCGEVRLRRGLSLHGGRPLGPRISFVG